MPHLSKAAEACKFIPSKLSYLCTTCSANDTRCDQVLTNKWTKKRTGTWLSWNSVPLVTPAWSRFNKQVNEDNKWITRVRQCILPLLVKAKVMQSQPSFLKHAWMQEICMHVLQQLVIMYVRQRSHKFDINPTLLLITSVWSIYHFLIERMKEGAFSIHCRRPGLKGYGAYVIWVYQDHTSTWSILVS